MIDIESTVFDTVAKAFTAAYPKGSRYGEEVDTPVSFPCITLIESDNYTYEKSLTDEMREHHANLMYTLNIYSNKTSGAKQECKAILVLLDEKMRSLGFVRTMKAQTKNQDSKIYRIAARYRAVVSDDYRIYRR